MKTQQELAALKDKLFYLIDDNDLFGLFDQLRIEVNIFSNFKTYQEDYTDNKPKGVDLRRFKESLKLFISDRIANANYSERKIILVILTSNKRELTTIAQSEKRIPLERYGQHPKQWRPYNKEAIEEMLKEFATCSEIELEMYYYQQDEITSKLRESIKALKKKIILIVDPFSLHLKKNEQIAKFFDETNKDFIGGCMIPLCRNYSPEQYACAKTIVKNTFIDLVNSWRTEFCRSYAHAELEIPDKFLFFRRLANLAFYKGVSEKETIATLEVISKKYRAVQYSPISSSQY